MITARRISLAIAASGLTVLVVFALLAVHPIPVLSPDFVAVGFILASPILDIAPASLVHALAPRGGPDAVAWAVAIGTFLAWFVVFFGLWFGFLLLRDKPWRHSGSPR